MAATMRRSPDSAVRSPESAVRSPDGRVRRFDRTERSVHWSTALMALTLVLTGAILYVPSLSVAVGRRLLVENTHIYVGLALFVPVLAGALGRWGTNLRSDLRQMSRMTAVEMSWLRSIGRQGRRAIGKFNPGQKLNTVAVGGLLVVLFATGIILRWGNSLPVSIRTGATFTHDVFAIAFLVLVCGHIAFAVTHPPALRSMLTGWVPARWVDRHAPAWKATPWKPAVPVSTNGSPQTHVAASLTHQPAQKEQM